MAFACVWILAGVQGRRGGGRPGWCVGWWGVQILAGGPHLTLVHPDVPPSQLLSPPGATSAREAMWQSPSHVPGSVHLTPQSPAQTPPALEAFSSSPLEANLPLCYPENVAI